MAAKTDRRWLSAALAYLPKWLGFQMERYRQTGCSLAIVQGSKLIERLAFGMADLSTGETLTTEHRFRIASHCKTFTATGVMLLREQGKLGLDDAIGRYVTGLHKDLAKARVSELLSLSAFRASFREPRISRTSALRSAYCVTRRMACPTTE